MAPHEFQALYDQLTRLPNRELFRDRVERALHAARRANRTTAVLLFDLDGFKKVNDSLGHSAGDRLLAEVAARLNLCIRGSDTPSRLGGDEFAVLLQEIGEPEDAIRVATRIETALREPFFIHDREVIIRASIGIGISDGPAGAVITAEQLIRDADVAMYRAKDDPETSYRIFDPVMHSSALERLENEADLRRAIEANEFLLHYQPIVSLDSGAVTGVEALVRWDHPHRGMVAPLEFIPLAEDTGLIVPLGRWVLEEACRELATWPDGFDGRPVRLSVNISVRQLGDPALVGHVRAILEETGFDPRRLVLEVTENLTIEEDADVIARLTELRDIGIRIAIDDFGTGYSSLSYLARLPVDVLKIDRAFVRALGTGAAEGIENSVELGKLRATGCIVGQGFLFGRPVPGADAKRAIEAASRFSVEVEPPSLV